MNWQRPLTAVILLIAVTLVAGCHGDPVVRKQRYLESGKRFSFEGRYREAAIQDLNALKVDEDYFEAHYELARTYQHLGEFAAAGNRRVGGLRCRGCAGRQQTGGNRDLDEATLSRV